MKTILVSGCAGFIGSHLCEFLVSNNYFVIGIDNFDNFYSKDVKLNNLNNLLKSPNFQFFELDIRHEAQFSKLPANIDVVIHLAAKAGVLPSIEAPQDYIETNIVGSKNILEFIKLHNIQKCLFASSSSVYGNSKEIPFKESQEVNEPISPYAFTKKSCELMNYTYHHLYKIDIINLRFFTVYGPRQRPDLAIHKFVKLIANNQPIKMYGDGTSSRDYTYVSDTVAGIYGALQYILANENVYQVVNLGNNQPVKLNELISLIYEVMGKEPQVEKANFMPGDVDITFANIDKAKELFSYSPKVQLKEGLTNFLAWYEQQN